MSDQVSTDAPSGQEPQSWTQLGKEMWSYLTGKGAAINYEFVDMHVEVPRDTGARGADCP